MFLVGILLSIRTTTLQADNTSIDDGSWFDPANWENSLGGHLVPSTGDGETTTLITDGFEITLAISNGSVHQDLTLGSAAGSGTLSLTSGTLSIPRILRVSNNGAGTLNLSGDAEMTVSEGILAGTGALGTITISDTAILQSTNQSIILGNSSGSTGSLVMTGGQLLAPSTSADQGELYVGLNGTGIAQLSGSSLIQTRSNVFIGFNDQSIGSIVLNDNSSLQITNPLRDLLIGTESGSTGSLFMNDSSSLSADTINIGVENGSAGSFTISGGTVNLSGQLNAGLRGTGAFTATGTEASPVSILIGNDLTVGNGNDSTGTVLINGTHTTVQIVDAIGLGVDQNTVSSMTLAGSAQVTAFNRFRFGIGDDSENFFRIQDDAVLNVTNEINFSETAGDRAINNIEIAGGTITAGDLVTLRAGTMGQTTIDMTDGELNTGTISWISNTAFNLSGGTVNADLYTGGAASNSGATVLTLTGGTFNLTDDLELGGNSSVSLEGGTLDIGDLLSVGTFANSDASFSMSGGTLNLNDNLVLAQSTGSNAEFTFSGGTINHIGSGSVDIGLRGSANATVSSNANAHFTGQLLVGRLDGSEGILTLRDTSQLTFDGTAFFGAASGAEGTLALEDDAVFNSNGAIVLGNSGGSGTLSASGDSQIILTIVDGNSGNLNVGQSGTGDASFSDNSSLQTDGGISVGLLDNSDGLLMISGSASIESDGNMVIGQETEAIGEVEMTGGTLDIGKFFSVGVRGEGLLEVTGNESTPSIITVVNDFQVGSDTDAIGTVNMGGTHTTMTVNGDVELAEGDDAIGELNLSGGAIFNAKQSLVMSNGEFSSATLTLTDTAQMIVSGNFSAGESGNDGIETILEVSGGKFEVMGEFVIDGDADVIISGGELSAGTGMELGLSTIEDQTISITQTGGSVNVEGTLSLSNAGGDVAYSISAGNLEVSEFLAVGAFFSSGSSLLEQSGGNVVLTEGLSNIDSVEISGGTLSAGSIRNGLAFDFGPGLQFAQGSSYSQTGGSVETDTFFVTEESDATLTAGSIDIATSATVNDGSTLNLFGGIFRIEEGGSLSNEGQVNLAGSIDATLGTVTGDGEIRIANSFTGQISADSLTVVQLGGSGTVTANINSNGTVSPGNSPGHLTIDGDLTLNPESRIEIEIAGLLTGTEYDQLEVTGTLDLNGTLSITLLDGFLPDFDDTFIVSMASILNGEFDGFANGARIAALGDDEATLGRFSLFYGPGSSFDPNQIVLSQFSAVPEPAALPLLAGLLSMAMLRRRRLNCHY